MNRPDKDEGPIMAESVRTPSPNVQPLLQAPTFRQLVPNPAATFKGSFAPGNREEDRLLPSQVGTGELIRLYLTEGWNDASIYRSAVGCLLSRSHEECEFQGPGHGLLVPSLQWISLN